MIYCPESWPSFSARDELQVVLDTLGTDELRVLTEIAQRLQRGAEIYGRLDLERDKRDFDKEGDEELDDWLFYFVCQRLKRRTRR